MEMHLKYLYGFLLVAAASVFYGIIPLFVKSVLEHGMSVSCNAGYRYLVMVIVMWFWAVKKKCRLRVTRKQGRDLILFGVLGQGVTNYLLGSAYLRIDMWLATICHFVYPVIVVLVMRLVFGQKWSRAKAAASVLTAGGFVLLLICEMGAGAGTSVSGILMAAMSGISYGSYVIALDKASFAELEKPVIVFYVSLACCVFFWIQSVMSGGVQVPSGTADSLRLAAAGLMSAMAMGMLARGIVILGAAKAAFLNMLEPVSNLVVDFFVCGTVPTVVQLWGSAMILGAIGAISVPEKSIEMSRRETA